MYGKIFEQIYDGTLAENWQALITFQQMIVLCDADGTIDMTPQAISRRTGIPIEHIEAGIEFLEREDPYSRSPDENGKRIKRLDEHRPWGWSIVNHAKYKSLQDADTIRQQNRLRKQRERQRDKEEASRNVTDGHTKSRHTDTDTDTNTNTDTRSRGKTFIQDDFEVTPKMEQWFKEQRFQYITIEGATAQFIDYWKSKGKMMKDWTATWRNGMRKQEEWAQRDGRPIIKREIKCDNNPETRYAD